MIYYLAAVRRSSRLNLKFALSSAGIIRPMRSRVMARRVSRARAAWPLALLSLGALMLAVGLGGWWAYEDIPSVRFRVQTWWGQARDVIAPHPDIVPTPAGAAAAPALTFPSATPSPQPMATATRLAASSDITPPAAATLVVRTPTATPPSTVILTGFKHEYQLYNNCGPASLAVNLSYWGWDGNQKIAAPVLKPNQDDKNVSPRELYEYLLTQGFDAYIRVNGDVDTLKRFIAAGYPVLVEKGFVCENTERCKDWFGHYSVFAGYDDARRVFILQDTYRGPDIRLSYDELATHWRAFNFLYVVAFPAGAEQDAQVVSLLGPAADLDQNYRDALARAQYEALTLTGQDAAFAWFNVGTNLSYLRDYAGAAAAYDQARRIGLPYRMLWYQFGPYRSYYQMARYQDVIDLATFAIESANVPGLEEAYSWRGQAEETLGLRDQAIADYRETLKWHPGDEEAMKALEALGETP